MAIWTLAQFRDSVRAQLDVDTDEVTDADLTMMVNGAVNEIIGDERWPFLAKRVSLSVVAGTDEYDLSTLATDLEPDRIDVISANNRVLGFIDPWEYFLVNPTGGTEPTGVPTHFTVLDEDKLTLFPNPTTSFTAGIVYLRVPVQLTADGDQPPLPERYQEVLRLGVLYRGFQFIDEDERAELIKAEYRGRVQQMRDDLLSAPHRDGEAWGGHRRMNRVTLDRARYPWE